MATEQTPAYTSASSGPTTIVLAGASGELGLQIALSLLERGAYVRALIRRGSTNPQIATLREQGATVVEVDFANSTELMEACVGAACVVSALSGLRDVIVDTQTQLLNAAVAAGVPRFIPSDYSIDYTKLPYGSNRNLDLRREFQERLDKAPIAATSVLNGMFTDLLTGQAPVVLFKLHRVAYWGQRRPAPRLYHASGHGRFHGRSRPRSYHAPFSARGRRSGYHSGSAGRSQRRYRPKVWVVVGRWFGRAWHHDQGN